MIDLDEALHDHGRRWRATAHEPPPLDDAVRTAVGRRRSPHRSVLAAAAVVLIVAAIAVTIVLGKHSHAGPAGQPAVSESPTHPPRTAHAVPLPAPTRPTTLPTPIGAITPFPKVTALPMTATDLKRATYWGRKYVQIERATATGTPAHTHLVTGGSWPQDVVRVEAIVVSIKDGGRLFGEDLTGGALPTASNKVIVLHLVGRFFTNGEVPDGHGRLVPGRVSIRSILATIGINGGQYDGLGDATNAHSGPIIGATQLSP